MKSKSKQKWPRMTIVTPSFNQGRFIERTIESVLGQNYPNLEYLVIDGGSKDNTLEVLGRYEGRLRWISEKDSGQSDAINKGFRMATGNILAWLNSDDVYVPGALHKVGKYFAQNRDVMMVYGEGYMIDANDEIKSRFPFTEPKFDLWKLIYYGDYILQQSTFYRREVFDSIDMLDESLHYTMDWDLFIRIGKRFRVDYIPEFLGSIREHGEAKTSTGGAVRFREIRRLIRSHGIRRFPLAYFNYAWDVYGKAWLPNASTNGGSAAMAGPRAIARRILELLYARYQRRLQQGYFPDGWVGKSGMIVLPNLNPVEKKERLLLEGEAAAPNTPFHVEVVVNRRVTQTFCVESPGPFQLQLDFPAILADSGCYHIELKSRKTFVPSRLGISQDNRELAFLLKMARLVKSECGD